MHNAVERFGGGGAWAQQRRELLEQLLYLWWEGGNGGDGLGLQGLVKGTVLALENVQPKAACKTCCFEGIIKKPNFVKKIHS